MLVEGLELLAGETLRLRYPVFLDRESGGHPQWVACVFREGDHLTVRTF